MVDKAEKQDASRTPSQVLVNVNANTPLPNPEGANFFHFTVVGAEVQLLVGAINLLKMHHAAQNPDAGAIVPDITHRFLLSPVAFHQLKLQLDRIHGSVPSAGMQISVKSPAKKNQ